MVFDPTDAYKDTVMLCTYIFIPAVIAIHTVIVSGAAANAFLHACFTCCYTTKKGHVVLFSSHGCNATSVLCRVC